MRLNAGKPLAQLKAEAYVAIDERAEACRMKFVTPGSGQAMEYQRNMEEIAAYQALPAGTPEDDFPSRFAMLQAERQAVYAVTGTLPSWADTVATMAALNEQWTQVGSAVKFLRRRAKLLVEAATSPAEVRAALEIPWPEPPPDMSPV